MSKPTPGAVYRVVSTGATSGLRHWYEVGTLVKCHAGTVPSCYAHHEDAGEFREGIDGTGKRQTVRLVDLTEYVPNPEPLLGLAPGDRAVVESDIFTRPEGAIGVHSEFGDGPRPKVGEVVTIERVCPTTGDYEVRGFRISPEGLVPAPRFVPGDRVAIVSSPYVGSTRKEGAVGTVVSAPAPGDIRGIARPDYAVDIDGDYYGVWGFMERHLGAAHVEPVGFGTAMHEAAMESYSIPTTFVAGVEPEAVEEFEDGDAVTIVGPSYSGYRDYVGLSGQIEGSKDADGDYRVDFEDGDFDYFAPSSLEAKAEEPEAEAEPEPGPADYVLRLKASAQAAAILAAAGYSGILGSDVAALAEFLLGIEKRQP